MTDTTMSMTEVLAQPYTYQKHKAGMVLLETGGVTIDHYPEIIEMVVGRGKDELAADLNTRTMKQLKGMFYVRATTKKEAVKDLADALVSQWKRPLPNGGSSGWWMSQESYETYMRRDFGKITQAHIDQYVEDKRQQAVELQRAISNPQTLADFNQWLKVHELGELSAEQRVLLDKLIYERDREQIERDRERAATIRQIEVSTTMTIEKQLHTKRGCDVWVVKLEDRVERDEFNALNAASKKLGGHYSRFAGGFLFWEEADAEKFVALQDDDQSALERWERIDQMKAEQAAERLLDYATDHADAATYELTRDRLTNTVRRVGMAISGWNETHHELAVCETVERLAIAKRDNNLDTLQSIQYVTQIMVLWQSLHNAHSKAIQDENNRYVPQEKRRPVQFGDIHYAYYLRPFVSRETLEGLVSDVKGRRGTRGLTQVVENIVSEMTSKGAYWANLTTHGQARCLNDLTGICRNQKIKTEVYRQIADWKRLQALGLSNVAHLRHALREFFQYTTYPKQVSEITLKELKLVGRKIEGFVPTPEDLARLAVNSLDIDGDGTGLNFLEPSAGKGNIAEVIREQYPQATLHTCEINGDLREILKDKGFVVREWDFMEFETPFGQPEYDAIVMNPPFEIKPVIGRQDIAHVMKAYGDHLKVGGTLVAIVSSMAIHGSTSDSTNFAEFVDDNGWYQDLPSDAFEESGKSVATCLVVLKK